MTPEEEFETFLKSDEGLKLTESLFHSMFVYAVERGQIDPKGKSEEALRQDFVKLLEGIDISSKIELIFITDYRSSILQQARLFLKAEDHRLACLLYGTWFEHWLNWLITTVGKRRGLDEDEVTQIIRDTPFRGKLTWMFPLLGLRHLPANHKNAIFKITDLRNNFVHYKWKGKGEEADGREEKELVNCLAAIEKTVKYLNHYESKHIFHHKKKVLKKIVKLRGSDE